MSNFAARNLSLGQVNALVKKLGGETIALAIIADTLKFTLTAVEGQPYNGSNFFQTRAGLWVHSTLACLVGLDGHTTRGTVPVGRLLSEKTSDANLFGNPGSSEYKTTLLNAVDLGQIEAMITAQWDGHEGDLLTDTAVNIFPMIGKDAALHVVSVRRCNGGMWDVRCRPFRADGAWFEGDRVFSN